MTFGPLTRRHLFLKPNLVSADPPPGSTHNDTLAAVVRWLRDQGAGRLSVGDRSGMGKTRVVMNAKGLFRLGEELGFDTVVLDEMDAGNWHKVNGPGNHWRRGFAIARPALEADGIFLRCCQKTRRYGGHFGLSLKNSGGLIAGRVSAEAHNYMIELRLSRHPLRSCQSRRERT